MFGADEAGRGPVLGSLFIGFVDAPAEALPPGLADSKDLSEAEIQELTGRLRRNDAVITETIEVPTGEIDAVDSNITSLTAAAMATAIETVGVSEHGIVDACHTDPTVFGDAVRSHLPADSPVTVDAEHEADTRVEQVMAASILAKHDREQHVAALREQYGDIGSGYPSDPETTEFLEAHVAEHGSLPECARRSWTTSQDVLEAAEQTALSAFTSDTDA